jgi:hypothetical protein
VRPAWAVVLPGCAASHLLPPEQACEEVGTAIGARLAECTGDDARGEAAIEAFAAEYRCLLPVDGLDPREAYACALATRNLACELADVYGDDLDAWLTASPTCDLVVAPVGAP